MGGWDQYGSQGEWLRDLEWIYLAEDRDRWRAVVNTVMNLRVLAPPSYSFIMQFYLSSIFVDLLSARTVSYHLNNFHEGVDHSLYSKGRMYISTSHRLGELGPL
jgi:hypothetical protein